VNVFFVSLMARYVTTGVWIAQTCGWVFCDDESREWSYLGELSRVSLCTHTCI
jgi:hypothetical protein